MRVLIAECKQETSTFNPVVSRYDDFEVNCGPALLDYHRRLRTEVAGAVEILLASNVDIVPVHSIRAITSGGPVSHSDYERLTSELLHAIRGAPTVDAVYLCLHGAMVSEREPDPEGFLIREVREVVGPDVPIVASFDLHGIPTARILHHADAVVAFHTYPHVDLFETGQRAARLLLTLALDGARPVTALVRIPLLVRGRELITETGLIAPLMQHAKRLEFEPGFRSAGLFIGNPFTDVPDLGSSSFVVADDPERAASEATWMAERFWEMRERLQESLTSLEDAVAIAHKTHGGTVILTDAADAPSSGASGDSNTILRALRESGYQGRTLLPLVDPGAVQAAIRAGVGAVARTTVGGALDPARFTPLPVEARVRMVSDGEMVNESDGATWPAGLSAVLQVDNFTIIATTRPVSLYDRSLFLFHGQDPRSFDAVVVKSPHCQPHMFSEWAARVVNVDACGSTSANLRSLGHTQCARPMFPLDEIGEYRARAEMYRREQGGES